MGTLVTACSSVKNGPRGSAVGGSGSRTLEDIERRRGGRLGVFALDIETGRTLSHRADERFAMCSTFKWILAAAVLARCDRRELALSDQVFYGAADLLEYAPVTREQARVGSMTIEALARAAVTVSDNTAANLLLAKIGGPAALTAFMRATGDDVTRLDRTEPALNSNDRDDPRDTTSPRAMVDLMRRVLCDGVLSTASRERLLRWLRECETGAQRLRAGFPSSWVVGDKTGSGAHNAVNDVAIALPPVGAPILIASFTSDGLSALTVSEAAHAEVGNLVARELGA
jgi:beta-lactamase class A